MTKYIPAEKLITEINNRLMSVNLEELGNFGCHRVWAYNDVKDLITSLQQDKPEVDIDIKQELYRHFGQVKDFTLGVAIASYFYELGKAGKED